ncbi:tripeptidyl-peptidase I [Malassezia cuniculi]|uniref:tripeptidyl-peptidase II n=1 Tax=Malassezia cuniculi TaxID=948313 RepID=A0AAF0J5Z9_9BASI|nr:tripeptidyl-peptidase I [Malassezia cuniculi]
MISRWPIAAILIAALAEALAAPPNMVVKERVNVPSAWVRRGDANKADLISLSVALKPSNETAVYDRLDQTSDPDSDSYGSHLSREEVFELMSPSNSTRQSVDQWLSENDVQSYSTPSYSPAGDWVTFEVPVSVAHKMLGGADFGVFEHRSTGERVVRTTEYLLPRDLAPHIDFIGGTTYFSTARSLRIPGRMIKTEAVDSLLQTNILAAVGESSKPSSCNVSNVKLDCLRELYGTIDYTPSAPSKGHIGVAGFLEENANYEDLEKYLKDQRKDAYKGNATFDYVTLNGAQNNQNLSEATGEANLDIQTVVGVTWPIRTTYFDVGGRPPFLADENTKKNTNEPYAHLNNYLLNLTDDKIPQVLSISYGDDEQTVPEAYARRVCWQYAAMGLRGMSVLQASGDGGVGAEEGDVCVTNDKKAKKTFLQSFPSSCPYITVVGAVEHFAPEVVATYNLSGISSGAGFSRLFDRPSWQNKSVADYITMYLGTRYHGLYNPMGRAYPDVSAQGSLFSISVGGKFGRISGTSASTPLFASIVALLNDARLAENKTVLGYLNPLIYKKLGNTDAFNDIVNGSAVGCGVDGFPASKGWDAVTGFGTPNFKNLLKALP